MTATRQDVGTTTYTSDEDRGLLITRVFHAPAQLVWDAFTKPEHVPNWMGPAVHAMTTCEIDLRVGGAWRYVYALDGGASLGHGGIYTEIDPPHKLVSTESFDGVPGESINTMTLTEVGDLTICELHCLFPSAEVRDMAAAAMKSGVDEGFSRLDALLPTLEITSADVGTTGYETVGDRELVITRVFAAPVAFVFDAWTNPEHLPNWLGPAKHEMITCDIDLRPGGSYRYVWKLAEGGTMGMGGTYDEVDPPHRIVATEAFDDWPGESVNTMDLIEAGDFTICRVRVVYSTPEGRDGAMGSGMQRGIDEGYDRFDALVAQRG